MIDLAKVADLVSAAKLKPCTKQMDLVETFIKSGSHLLVKAGAINWALTFMVSEEKLLMFI